MNSERLLSFTGVDGGSVLDTGEKGRKLGRPSEAPNRPLPYALECLTAFAAQVPTPSQPLPYGTHRLGACLF